MVDGTYNQTALIAALEDPARFGGDCCRVDHLETHISHVLLTGAFAYKIKKPVDLGFLDFTTLARRKRFCEQELRLNRRLAPAIYLDVVPITGSAAHPVVAGAGDALEYAVKMREFPQDALASRMLASGTFAASHVDALAAEVAAFHGRIDAAGADTQFGAPETVLRIALQNFDQIAPRLDNDGDRAALAALRAWTEREHRRCLAAFRVRKDEGFVRECHGDLHLGNIAVVDRAIVIFDCIEFNDELRWIDVMNEVAFTVMDLADRGRPDLAHRFRNAYLEITGDYAGLSVLRYYLVYRALVRAKIACLRSDQVRDADGKAALVAECRGYVDLASRYAQAPQPAIVVTHGLSGSGKTALTEALVELTGAVRVRTDVERKRLHRMDALARSGSAVGTGLYASDATERTYRRVLEIAGIIADAGGIAIADGTFLGRRQRDLFRACAAELRIPFVIIAFAARVETLRSRIAMRTLRATDASDADLAVLEDQLRTQEPLDTDEHAYAVPFDAETPLADARDPARWNAVIERLRPPGLARD